MGPRIITKNPYKNGRPRKLPGTIWPFNTSVLRGCRRSNCARSSSPGSASVRVSANLVAKKAFAVSSGETYTCAGFMSTRLPTKKKIATRLIQILVHPNRILEAIGEKTNHRKHNRKAKRSHGDRDEQIKPRPQSNQQHQHSHDLQKHLCLSKNI